MKILHVSHSDLKGGAAIAAYRIHTSLLDKGSQSKLIVNFKYSKDNAVELAINKFEYIFLRTKQILSKIAIKALITKNPILHSISFFPSRLLNKINESDADIVHLHWVQHEMLSIIDISKIKKPIVWTLHDMWPFCGAEHISMDDRWKVGYKSVNRPKFEKGVDINRWVWLKKKKYWINPFNLIAPSMSHAEYIKKSALMHNWPLSIIPNPIDTDFWKPLNKEIVRKRLKIPLDIPSLLFTSMTYGKNSYNKGVDLFLNLLKMIPSNTNLQIIVIGKSSERLKNKLNFPVYFFDYSKKTILRDLYNAADITLVPSRKESFGQIASESNACGTPVLAFKIGGLKDIVKHKKTGYLAKPFEIKDLVMGLNWILSKKLMKKNIREGIVKKFSKNIIAKKYLKIYKTIYNQRINE